MMEFWNSKVSHLTESFTQPFEAPGRRSQRVQGIASRRIEARLSPGRECELLLP